MNGIGITQSGGLAVLEKLLKECLEADVGDKFVFILTNSTLVNSLVSRYQAYERFEFRFLETRNYMYRLYFENVKFKDIVSESGIDLIYNFTGSAQPYLDCAQLVKIQNLLFYSKTLNKAYKDNFKFILLVRQVLLKSLFFRFMLRKTKYMEIQSKHVEGYLSDFINLANKKIFIKSDFDVADFSIKAPKRYDFSKKIMLLYIVGPHFETMHKNFSDFTRGMVELIKLGVDFELGITLTKDQLAKSSLWDKSLDSRTNFYGYLNDPQDIESLFCDNVILVSTSIIETLGLHVLEAIRNGVVVITPNENYAQEVYGKKGYSYRLFDMNSLSHTVTDVINDKRIITDKILSQQKYIRENEMSKFDSIVGVFRKVLNV